MKPLLLLLALMVFTQYHSFAQTQTEFELEPNQVMLMTGKGPGQDGAINPYYGQDCIAKIENIGTSAFSIRIQQKGKLIEIIPLPGKAIKKITLLKGYELYFDSNTKEKVKAKLSFEKTDK